MELFRNPDSGQLRPVLLSQEVLVVSGQALGDGVLHAAVVLPTSQPVLLYLLAKTPQDAMRLPPPPCLSGKAWSPRPLKIARLQQAPGRRTLALRGGQEP